MIDVINWLICGTFVAAAAHAVSSCAPRVSASLRYHLWWLALVSILAAPFVPGLLPDRGLTTVRTASTIPSLEIPTATPLVGWLLAGIWASLTAYSLARLVIAAVVLRRRKREALPFPADIEKQLPLWNRRTGSRAARLAISPIVRSAAVLGGRSPVIAIAPRLLQGLTLRELDLVLMHEWAHVQRYDDVANAVQQVVRSVCAIHPGVRWCARQIDLQRELACDDRVVNESGSPKAYAACLARLAEMITVRRHVALAPGVVSGSHLTARVKAVLQDRPHVSRWRTGGFVGTGIVVLVVVATTTPRVAAVREPVHTAAELVAAVLPANPTATTTVRSAVQPPSVALVRNEAARRPPVRQGGRERTGTVAMEQVAATRAPSALASDDPSVSEASTPVPTLVTAEFGSGAGLAVPVTLPAPPSVPQAARGTWARVGGAGVAVGSRSSDAGSAIGRTSSDAARSTAGFFSKLGKSIAGGF